MWVVRKYCRLKEKQREQGNRTHTDELGGLAKSKSLKNSMKVLKNGVN